MAFETNAGPAILVANICSPMELARRLHVHVNSIYNWINKGAEVGFPEPLPCGHFDYEEVYPWYVKWVKDHPTYYPDAYEMLMEEEKSA